MHIGWTEDRAAQARRMWSDGATASMIAEKLSGGITRNAILGKSHREGWPRSPGAPLTPKRTLPSPAKSPGVQDNGSGIHARDCGAQNAKPQASSARAPEGDGSERDREKLSRGPAEGRAATPVDPPSDADRKHCWDLPANGAGVPFIRIRNGLCRWPLGDPRDLAAFRFCGCACKPTQTYCDEHAALASPSAGQEWWAKRQEHAAAAVTLAAPRQASSSRPHSARPKTFEAWERSA